jgi:hypothetical protein
VSARVWPPVHPLHLVIGLTIWFLWFSLLYGGVALACVVAPPAPPHTVFNAISAAGLAFTGATVLLFAWAGYAAWRAGGAVQEGPGAVRSRFVARLSAALYGVAAVSTVAVGLPLLVVPPCV